MPELLKAAGMLRREVGDDILVTGCVVGSMTLAVQTMGAEAALFLAIDEPEEFASLLDFAADVAVRFGVRQLEAGPHLPMRESELASGVRLACRKIPRGDLEIAVLAPERESVWRPLPDAFGGLRNSTDAAKGDSQEFVGAAVDLGTTYIRVSLFGLSGRRRLAGRYALNPQSVFGADVITRLLAASASEKNLNAMRGAVFESIGEALREIASKEGISPERVTRMCIVGNTAMILLLSGRNTDMLLKPAFWGERIDCVLEESGEWAEIVGIHPEARIETVPPLAGFVGSDLLAGVLATELTTCDETSLFVDFGTNSEIALCDGRKLWVTSAAGGPVFEGSGLSCGIPAERGAVYRVRREANAFVADVLGGSAPRGICGSGLVDLVAELVHAGLLDDKGRFAPSVGEEGFALSVAGERIVLTRSDVDLFQRAKAAIGAGIETPTAVAGVRGGEIGRVRITGAFGGWLNVENARSIGLLPRLSAPVELCEGAALKGCERMLLSQEESERAAWIRDRTEMLNLAHHPEFEDAYLEHLYLRPAEVERGCRVKRESIRPLCVSRSMSRLSGRGRTYGARSPER